jgi:glycosyltransferase involved in cell wall biosynthesis
MRTERRIVMSGTTLAISIIIPCHAPHAEVLRLCLASLTPQSDAPAYEIIVVNSNNDVEVAQAAALFPVRLVDGGGKLTAGAARNRGVAAATGELVAFIDADCTAEEYWLRTIARNLTGGVVAVSGSVLDYFPWHPIAMVDNRMQFMDQLPGRPAGGFASAPGCNLAVLRDVFMDAGGFPEQAQPGEDTILTAQLADRFPGRVLFEPAMRVRHRGRTSFREFLRHQRDFGFGRGLHRLNLTARQQALCRHRSIVAAAAVRRYTYVIKRTAQWKLRSLPYLILLTPLLLAGLAAWAQGLHRGCCLSARE